MTDEKHTPPFVDESTATQSTRDILREMDRWLAVTILGVFLLGAVVGALIVAVWR